MTPSISGWQRVAGVFLLLDAVALLVFAIWGLIPQCPEMGCEGASSGPALAAVAGVLLILLTRSYWRGSGAARRAATIIALLQVAAIAWLSFGLGFFTCFWAAAGCEGRHPLQFLFVGGLGLVGIAIVLGSVMPTTKAQA